MEPLLRTVRLVEGVSDQRALEALARRRGRNLDAERISIVPMGGATNIGHFLRRLGPRQKDDERSPSERRADGLDELVGRVLDSGELPERGGQRPHIAITATPATAAPRVWR